MISISIHALRKESDLDVRNITRDDGLFQSTLSVRRATGVAGDLVGDLRISIHALRNHLHGGRAQRVISIHALRKESDTARAPELAAGAISIHALRKESDSSDFVQDLIPYISIHALRKESDAIANHE